MDTIEKTNTPTQEAPAPEEPAEETPKEKGKGGFFKKFFG